MSCVIQSGAVPTQVFLSSLEGAEKAAMLNVLGAAESGERDLLLFEIIKGERGSNDSVRFTASNNLTATDPTSLRAQTALQGLFEGERIHDDFFNEAWVDFVPFGNTGQWFRFVGLQGNKGILAIAARDEDVALLAQAMCEKGKQGWRRAAKEQEKSYRHHLTLLPDRRALEEIFPALTGFDPRVGQEERRQDDHEKGVSLVFIDLDGFKSVNDTHGHDAGDQILKEVARRLQDHRADDLAFHIGGDEFAFLLHTNDLDHAGDAAVRLHTALVKEPFLLADGTSIPLAATFGVAGRLPCETLVDLMRRADQAMYRAKQEGKNHVAIIDKNGGYSFVGNRPARPLVARETTYFPAEEAFVCPRNIRLARGRYQLRECYVLKPAP